MCRVASPESPMNSLFKTIFWAQLYWLIGVCFPTDALSVGRPKWMCKGFSSATDKRPFQYHLSSPTVLTHRALPPRRLEQWMCRIQSNPVSLMNGLFKMTFRVKLSYQLDELCLLGDSPVWLINRFLKSIFSVKLF